MRKLTRTEVDEILLAATILGTGGGGSLDEGMKLMDEIFSQGKDLILADYDEVPEDALIGSPYMCGAISPLTEEEIAKYKDLPVMEDDFCVIAARSMEEFIGKKFAGFNSVEFGGGNTAVAMYVAATAGVPIMNCDAAGRAVPDLQLSTYNIHGINIAPVAVANEFGDQAIFTHLVNDYRAEDMVRALAVVSKNAIGVVDHINTAGVLKDAVILGAMDYLQKVGHAWNEAKNAGRDPIAACVEAGGGRIAYYGTVKEQTYDTVNGYTVGDTYITTEDNDELHIWFRNENIVMWKNGDPHYTAPDLICIVDAETGRPVCNPNLKPNEKVAVLLFPCDPMWKTPKGIELLGPRAFGFDFDPIHAF